MCLSVFSLCMVQTQPQLMSWISYCSRSEPDNWCGPPERNKPPCWMRSQIYGSVLFLVMMERKAWSLRAASTFTTGGEGLTVCCASEKQIHSQMLQLAKCLLLLMTTLDYSVHCDSYFWQALEWTCAPLHVSDVSLTVKQKVLKAHRTQTALYYKGDSLHPLGFCEEVIADWWCGDNALCRGGTFITLQNCRGKNNNLPLVFWLNSLAQEPMFSF